MRVTLWLQYLWILSFRVWEKFWTQIFGNDRQNWTTCVQRWATFGTTFLTTFLTTYILIWGHILFLNPVQFYVSRFAGLLRSFSFLRDVLKGELRKDEASLAGNFAQMLSKCFTFCPAFPEFPAMRLSASTFHNIVSNFF